METAHRGEVCGESFAVACLKLLDEESYVGGNHFLSGLRPGGREKGWDVVVGGGVAAHGDGSSVFEWPCCVCSQTRLGPWPTPAMGSKCKRWGAPPLERKRSWTGKGGAQRRSAQAKRGRLGCLLRARGSRAS